MKRLLIFDFLIVKKEFAKLGITILLVASVGTGVAQQPKKEKFIGGSSTPFGKIMQPQPAKKAGYKKLTFYDDFDSINSIDKDSTGNEGFKWYVSRPGGASTPPEAYSVSNSVLKLTSSMGTQGWAICSYSIKKNLGHSFRYGYFEARFRFDPSLGKNSRWFPTWWSYSVRNSILRKKDHWAELDFFEAYTGGFRDYDGAFVGTVHDWADSSKIHYQNSNNWQPLPKDTDFNRWHTYGCLWEPGKITWYFDDKPLMTVTYSATTPPNPVGNPPAPAGTYSILDTDPQGMLLILGSTPEWPMYVDWVRVWQQ